MKKYNLLCCLILSIICVFLFSSCGVSDESSTETIIYHNNETVNRFVNEYNEIALTAISTDMIEDGAYDFNAQIICNDVFMLVYANSTNGLFIEMSDETDSGNEHIKSVFKDIIKTLDSSIEDNKIELIWTELLSGNYKFYDYYVVNNLEITYVSELIMDNQTRYNLNIHCTDYF